MPGSLTGSYRSLSGTSDVYRSTTVAGGGGGTNAATGILEGMKKAFSFMAGGSAAAKDQKLIERVASGGPVIISSRYCKKKGLKERWRCFCVTHGFLVCMDKVSLASAGSSIDHGLFVVGVQKGGI